MTNNFSIILAGVGGQGIITMLQVIDEAAFIEGKEVRSSELHGLSQRGGSVEAHVRFGKKVYSPLVREGGADLIIGLEAAEGLMALPFAGNQTKFLINKHFIPFLGGLPESEILEKMPKENLFLVPASEVCKKELGKEVVSTAYLVGHAVKNNLIPLKKEAVISALKNVIPEKYLELNLKAFKLGYDS